MTARIEARRLSGADIGRTIEVPNGRAFVLDSLTHQGDEVILIDGGGTVAYLTPQAVVTLSGSETGGER